jgi:phage/plasmid-associated DNA primase
VEEMFEKIYPHEDEREIVQRYFGYCLLGYHPQKEMLLLTDARGGYNGKSTVCKAVRAVMGAEYSMKPLSNCMYYTDRPGNIESHASGTLSFRGYRLAVIEELNPSQRLDSQFLKDCTGGCTTFRGRVIRTDQFIEFEWITKLILAFNGGNMPRFDAKDRALQDRMLVVQHRSRFHITDEEYARESHIPFTYKAKTNLDGKIHGKWRSALLMWCLDGLKNYVEKEFRVVPAACQEWRRGLVGEQDCVGIFLRRRLERTGVDTDVLKQTDIFTAYRQEMIEDRERTIVKSKFFDETQSFLGKDCFKEFWTSPQGIRMRNVFFGWRLIEEGD